MRRFCVFLVISMIFSLCGCSRGEVNEPMEPGADRLSVTTQPILDIAAAVEMARGAVVGISTMSVNDRNAFVQGVGTGFIVDESGLAITNQHVIGGAARVSAIMDDGSKRKAQVLWQHEALDLAVIKIEGENFPYLDIFSAKRPRVGDSCLAIGTPLSMQFQHSVTGGIISSLGRTLVIPEQGGFSFFQDLIQTDASVNPGNSGGPLINYMGKVIGIVTLKINEAEGIGFAIPIEIARPVIRSFISKGEFVTPYIGVYAIDADLMQYYDSSTFSKSDIPTGLHILSVTPGSPAEKAGIGAGDVIKSVDDTDISTMLELRMYLFTKNIGDIVTIHLSDRSVELEIDKEST